jgi:hypothetical protein
MLFKCLIIKEPMPLARSMLKEAIAIDLIAGYYQTEKT